MPLNCEFGGIRWKALQGKGYRGYENYYYRQWGYTHYINYKYVTKNNFLLLFCNYVEGGIILTG
jgi:hypothetical protein